MFFFENPWFFCHKFMDNFHKTATNYPALYHTFSIDFQLFSVRTCHLDPVVFKPHHHLVS